MAISPAAKMPMPCPFCGAVEGPYVIGDAKSSFVRCAICGAEGPDPDSGISWDNRSPTVNEMIRYGMAHRDMGPGFTHIDGDDCPCVITSHRGMNESVAAYCERYSVGPSRKIAWRAFEAGYLAATAKAESR